MKIRNFTPHDLEKVLEFRKKSAVISFPDSKPDMKTIKKSILETYKKDKEAIKVVEENGKVIAHIILKIKKTSMNTYGMIDYIFVDEMHRGRGIATKLMKLAEEYFRKKGIRKLRATITLTNTPSLKMSKKLGYKEKRVIMEKDI